MALPLDSVGGALTGETRACVMFSGVQQVGKVEEEGWGAWWWLFLQKQGRGWLHRRGHGWSLLQKRGQECLVLQGQAPQAVALAKARAGV